MQPLELAVPKDNLGLIKFVFTILTAYRLLIFSRPPICRIICQAVGKKGSVAERSKALV